MSDPHQALSKQDTLDRLRGDDSEKDRLRMILACERGELPVEEACAQLGIERARYYQLRDQAFQGALDGLAPRKPGRPPKPVDHVDPEKEALRQEVDRLEVDLEVAHLRTELALLDPELLSRQVAQDTPKKGAQQSHRKARKAKRSQARKSRKQTAAGSREAHERRASAPRAENRSPGRTLRRPRQRTRRYHGSPPSRSPACASA